MTVRPLTKYVFVEQLAQTKEAVAASQMPINAFFMLDPYKLDVVYKSSPLGRISRSEYVPPVYVL